MPPGLVEQLPSLGISGLLFVMWWCERRDRAQTATGMQEALRHSFQIAEINERLLEVIRQNTEALTALREELCAHRASEKEWFSRLSRQLEGLEVD